MKKILLVVLAVILNSHVALAESNFLNSDWWKTATAADVQREINNGAKVNVLNSNGNTALMRAVVYGSPEAIKVLLKAGVNVNAKDQWGNTALKNAVCWGKPEVIQLLIKNDANIHIKDKEDRNLLWHAARHNRDSKVVRVLLDAGLKITPNMKGMSDILDGAIYNYWEADIVKKLIDVSGDINAKKYERGDTILINAARRSPPKIVRLLLDAGADVNIKNYKGETALMSAAGNCRSEVVKMLLEAGADVNAKDKDGQNAWYRAANYLARRGCPRVEKTLKEAGAETSKIKIGREKVKEIVVRIISIPIALVYFLIHGMSFEEGLACIMSFGMACGSR